MKKLFTILMLAVVGFANGQLAEGSIAPNFTAIDINGNEWNLYDILDEGKSVVIDVSATWCGPCWSYHETGALEDVYTNYGPEGTDEMMVLWVEGDASTNIDCIYDEPGCNSTTMGDWTDGVDYPIIDDASLADLYEISYYPTIYHICTNRIVTIVGQAPASEIYAAHGTCPQANLTNNASIHNYDGESGSFCGELEFSPSIDMQNSGLNTMTAATIELTLNDNVIETVNWSGSLETWAIENILFSSLSIDSSSEMEITIVDVNGAVDDDESDNQVSTSLTLATSTAENYITIQVYTDNYPGETSWELTTDQGVLLSSGDNYTDGLTLYEVDVVIPVDGCYEFVISDTFGDGICCVEGDGYYSILDSEGNYIIEGDGNFGSMASAPINLEGGEEINNNGSLIGYSGQEGSICLAYSFSPIVTIQNTGANTMTSAVVEVSNGTEVILSQDWSGSVESLAFDNVQLDELTITTTTTLTYSLVEVNGEAVVNPSSSAITAEFVQNYTQSTTWSMEFQTDSYAEELYWEITDSDGNVVASGGNNLVGAEGGGTGLADPAGPGAYSANQLVELTIELPMESECYDFLLVDSYGDGLVDGGGGYIIITDSNGDDIINDDLSDTYFDNLNTRIVVDAQVGVNDIDNLKNLKLYPNPTDNVINTQFVIRAGTNLIVEIYNAQGQKLNTVANGTYSSGEHRISFDVSDLSQGVYYLTFTSNSQSTTERFVIVK